MVNLKYFLLAAGITLGAVAQAQTTVPGTPPSTDPTDPVPTDPPTDEVPSDPTTNPPASSVQLVNISVRGAVAGSQGNANNTFGGFTVSGGSMRVLVQGAGPRLRPTVPSNLTNFNVSNYLTTPKLDIWSGNTSSRVLIASNAAWGTQTLTNVSPVPTASTLTAVSSSNYGYDFESGSLDAATLISVAEGAYTMEFSSNTSATGVGVLGFWADSTVTNTGSFANISARGVVTSGTGGSLIAGTVVSGTGTARIVAIALGPSLTGLSGALAAPILTVRNLAGTQVATNTNWTTASNSTAIQTALTSVGSGITLDSTKADSAVLVDLEPNAYTFEVSTASGSGIALVGLWLVTN